MTREEIKKQWELEFGAKYEDYQRANIYTAVDILDFAERVVNKLLIHNAVQQSEQLPILDRCGCEEPNEEPIKVCMNCNGYVE